MVKSTASIHIDVPPYEVWAFLEDFSRTSEYLPDAVEVFDMTSDKLKVGSRYSERIQSGHFDYVNRWEVTEYEPFWRQTRVTKSALSTKTVKIRLKPVGDSTYYTQELEVIVLPNLRWLGKAIEKVFIRTKLDADLPTILSTIKFLLENKNSST